MNPSEENNLNTPSTSSASPMHENIPPAPTPEIILPENPETIPVPETFSASPLFQKEEAILEEKSLEQKKISPKQKFFIITLILCVIAVAGFAISQVLLEQQFSAVYFDETQDFGEGFNLNDDGTPPGDQSLACEGGFPFVRITPLLENTTFKPGEEAVFSWELCGLSPNLFDDASIEYFDSATNIREGSFDLDCLANFTNGTTQIRWNVPAYLESEIVGDCSPQDVDFADPYFYQLTVSYAGGQYQDTSDTFLIDVSEYTYEPPQFSEYALSADSNFSRAYFISENAPDPLREQIFPSYFQTPPQFANYYRIFDLSCGTNCYIGSYVIDLRTGEAFEAPNSVTHKVQVLSNLYITEQVSEATSNSRIVRWYEFEEATKSFTMVDTKICNATSGTNYTNCVQP